MLPPKMPTTVAMELDAFLQAHPDIRFFDAFLHDLNTAERGKRIDRAGIARLYESGMLLPGSMFALDVLGQTCEASGLGFDDGDADRPCRPIPGSLQPVPWLSHDGVAQLQLSMYESDGRPFFADPRQVLARVLDRFHRLNLTPVVALEYEFYLIDRERDSDRLPQPPVGPLSGRRKFGTQINSMLDLSEYSAVLSDIDTACQAQDVPATTALAEHGPGQFEVNLAHRPDALAACDQALRFKRIVKHVARAHGCEATFLPKPYRGKAGSGLHVHASLLDAGGRNLFAAASPTDSADLRHAIRGLLDTLADGMAICAPGPNSYRRFRPETYVPLAANWSLNNRGAALRIPHSDADNRRIEHRLAGADANPYLLVAWVLAGIHRGLSRGEEPPPPLDGNAYQPVPSSPAEPLPRYWPAALERFAGSRFAEEYLGRPFTELYGVLRRSELDEFESHVSPLEIERWLGPA
ncbi:MAG: glutamine synthetase family protein [Steroidobacteraceae bacterium]